MVWPLHVTKKSFIFFNFLFDPKSIDSVLPKCSDSLLSTNHLLHDTFEDSSRTKFYIVFILGKLK